MIFRVFLFFCWAGLAAGLLPVETLARLSVVASTPDLGSIAEAVGGERVKVVSLARGAEDPHFVSPRPSFIPILNRADVLIEGGAGLESSWLPSLVRSARNRDLLPNRPGHLSMVRHIDLLDRPTSPVDRSLGDVHALGNPHFMLDPENGRIAARAMAERFAALDPEGAETYEKNLERFERRIDEGLARWQAALEPFRGKQVVTYHKNYDYLARRFGFEIAGQIEPLAGVEPSARHIVGLIAAMRESGVSMIWMEPFRPKRTPTRVAQQTGARLLFLPEQVGAVEGTEDYVALFDYLVARIVEGNE